MLSDIIALESSRVHLDTPFFLSRYDDIKQLLDEVEHDIVTYQNRGLCYLPKPKAEADNTDLGFDNSRYHAKTEFNHCFIIRFQTICKRRLLV